MNTPMRQEPFTHGEITFAYRLYGPEKASDRLPLVVCLPDKGNGTDVMLSAFCSGEAQRAHPAFVLIPECPKGKGWDDADCAQALQRLLFKIRLEHPMDLCMTYLVGAGVGAVGAWHLLGSYPRVFAGTIAIDGCGDPYHARNAKFSPVWAFHAAQDARIDTRCGGTVHGRRHLAGSWRLVTALRTVGSQLARYSEEPGEADTLAQRVLSRPEVRDWLFAQDRMKVAWVENLYPGLWRIDDYFMSSCYLVEGADRALLIDTTMAEVDLKAIVAKLTDKPVSVAITHPHLDHMMHAHAFSPVYVHPQDIERMPDILAECSQVNTVAKMFPNTARHRWPEGFTSLPQAQPIRDGETIDLGGGVVIEAAYLGGHTPNHMAFIDRAHRCVFTGDAIGSGYVVGVNYKEGQFTQTYEWYHRNLCAFAERIEPCEEYTFFGGHFIQENSCVDEMQEDYLNGQSEFFVPLSAEVLRDMITLCEEILDHRHDAVIPSDGSEFFVTRGAASLAGRRI